MPVIFNLSSWVDKEQSLIDWMVAELTAKYQIPRRVGRPWLENNRLLPLLDGLDEVKPDNQTACVEAINHFGEEFGLAGLVVCSRLKEYTHLPVRLKLNGAVRLQPLTLEQIYDYLDMIGSELATLRRTLQEDDSLREMARSPLILGIMILVYQDISVAGLSDQTTNTVESRRKHLFDTYVEQMFKRKGQGNKIYSDQETRDWLVYLAQQLTRQNQAIFLIERLQPNWLLTWRQRGVYVLCSRGIICLVAGLAFGIILQMSFLDVGLMSRNIIFAMLGGLLAGLAVGIIDGFRLKHRAQYATDNIVPKYDQIVLNILLVGFATGLVTALVGGVIGGIIMGLATGVVFGLRGSWQSPATDIQTTEALSWSWIRALKSGLLGLIFALIIGLILVVIQGPLLGLTAGVIVGIITVLIGMFAGGLGSQSVDAKTEPNQGIRLSLRNAIFTGAFGTIIGFLFFWTGQGFNEELARAAVRGFLGFGLLVAVWYGGLDIIQHYTLRLVLWYNGYTPFNYVRFFDYATERILLQKVGGGYIFIHRLLLEHFAAMDVTEKWSK